MGTTTGDTYESVHALYKITESDTRDSMIQSMSYEALLPLLVGNAIF